LDSSPVTVGIPVDSGLLVKVVSPFVVNTLVLVDTPPALSVIATGVVMVDSKVDVTMVSEMGAGAGLEL
jgi:hypothetical protein